MPFGEEDADFEGNFFQPTGGLAHVVAPFVPVRSGKLNLAVPLVPESGSDLVEALAIQFAVVNPRP